MKATFFSLLFLSFSIFSSAQEAKKTANDFTIEAREWMHYDAKDQKIIGTSSAKLYSTLIKDKQAKKKIVVAIIDGGTDIEHEDLKDQIWINTDEIPNNGIDDDKNGYIDDIHGWNFLGNSKGENINQAPLEITRVYKQLKTKYASGTGSGEEFEVYMQAKNEYEKEADRITKEYKNLSNFVENFQFSDSVLKVYFKCETYTTEQLNAAESTNRMIQSSIDFQKQMKQKKLELSMILPYYEHVKEEALFRYNMDFDPRAELVGDNVNDINDTPYGNPDVKGPRADHGTMVAGLVAATRSNGLGIDGIANSVEIMVLRVVPDGDEYDKDVALAIRYAADNGAQIMNMSFGKAFSPNQKMVWDALRYAASKNILMVKASGNETIDIDSDVHYPTAFTPEGKIDNIITVGANDMKKGKKMSAVFSNYGATGVDIFAPGVDIVSPSPDQNYGKASGTSFASPVVTGVAALIWSYFPELTASELRTILLESGTYYGKQKVVLFNRDTEVKTKTTFGKLSVTGRIINAYNAFLMAEAKTKKQ